MEPSTTGIQLVTLCTQWVGFRSQHAYTIRRVCFSCSNGRAYYASLPLGRNTARSNGEVARRLTQVELELRLDRRGQARLHATARKQVFLLRKDESDPAPLNPGEECVVKEGDVVYLLKVPARL